MRCPFPGMDPYLERPEIWPDFHDSLIAAIRGILQPLLRPKYAAITQDRLYVVEADRPIRPDVAVVRTSEKPTKASANVGPLLKADAPAVFELWREEIRQPLVHIIEPAAGNRLITAIEVLSPDNKTQGPGRSSYLRKRDEFRDGGANLVEIDLLRDGQPTVRISAEQLDTLRPWDYLVGITGCLTFASVGDTREPGADSGREWRADCGRTNPRFPSFSHYRGCGGSDSSTVHSRMPPERSGCRSTSRRSD